MIFLQIANIGVGEAAVEASRVLLYFLASILVAIANIIFAYKKLNAIARVIIHYIIFTFAFYTCFLLPVNMRTSYMITGIVIFTLLYAVIMGSIAIFKSKLKKNRERNEEYKSQFSKKKK